MRVSLFKTSTLSILLSASMILSLLAPGFLGSGGKVYAEPASENILLQEDFNGVADGSLPSGWMVAGEGAFAVQNGKLTGKATANKDVRIVFGDASWRNYSFEADVTFISTENATRYESLMFRANANGDAPYYQFAMRKTGSFEMAYRPNDTKWDVKYTGDRGAAIDLSRTYRFKVSVFGEHVSQYLDGVLLHEGDYAVELLQGKAGFQVNRSTAEFDNVIVTKLDAESFALEGLPESIEQFTTNPFQVKAALSDGTSIDMTKQATVVSNDSSIADIVDGKLVAYQAGTATFTISCEGAAYNQSITVASSSEPITVTDLTLDDFASVLIIGEPKTLKATASYTDFSTLDVSEEATWSSDDASIASVADGVITPLAVGRTTIRAKLEGLEASVPIQVWNDPDFKNVWFYENFDSTPDGSLPAGWQQKLGGTTGEWSVQDGRIRGISSTNNPYSNTAIITLPFDLNIGNYVFEADVTFESAAASARYASLMFRVQPDAASYFQFGVRRGGGTGNPSELAYRKPTASWDVREKGTATALFDYGSSYHFKVIVSDDHFQAYIDDIKVIDTDKIGDQLLGGLGLQASGTTTSFDNVKVSIHPEDAPSPVITVPSEELGLVAHAPGQAGIEYIGRWDKTDSANYRSYWPGASFRTGFTGTNVRIQLAESTNLHAQIDNGPFVTYSNVSGTVDLTPTPLSEGTHTLTVVSKNAADVLSVQGLLLDGGADIVPLPRDRLIEFIGDSITEGYKTKDVSIASYAWLTGELLNVDHTQIAYPGICLVTNISCNSPNSLGMSEQYFKTRTSKELSSPEWNFNEYQPSAIVVNLGTNDNTFNVSDSTFQSTYTTFLEKVRSKNPAAEIFVLRTFGGFMVAPTIAAVNDRITAGDTKLHYIDTTEWVTYPADFNDTLHPSTPGNVKIAERLEAVLRPYLSDDGTLPVAAPELSGISLTPGTAAATTRVAGLNSGTAYKYAAGSKSDYTRPNAGDPSTAYANALTKDTNISAAVGDYVFVIELDDAGNIAKWGTLAVTAANVKEVENNGDVLLQENFDAIANGALPSGWKVAGEGTFAVQDGKLTGKATANKDVRIVFGDASWRNYSFEADVTFVSTEDNSRYESLMFRADANGEHPYYQYAMRRNGKFEMAYRTPLATWNVKFAGDKGSAIELSKVYRFKVTVFGNVVREYLDGVLLHEDDYAIELLQGKAGFQVNRSTAEFDNVKITKLEATAFSLEGLPASIEQYTASPYQVKAAMSDGTVIDVTNQAVISSSDSTIADIVDGKLVAYKEGAVALTIAYEGTTSNWPIRIDKSTAPTVMTELALDQEAVVLIAGTPGTLKAVADYSDFTSRDVTEEAVWSSDDESIAVVAKGVITPIAEGKTTIRVKKEGIEASVPIRVWNDPSFQNVWFYENFDSTPNGSLPAGWQQKAGGTVGTWSVQDGRIRGISTTNSPYSNNAIVTLPYDLNIGNYVFEADVAFESAAADARYASLMFRVQPDAFSYLQFAVRRGGGTGNLSELAYRTPAASWDVREKGAATGKFDLGKSYHFKVVASNDRFQAFIDDKLVINSNKIDDVLTGGLGLQASGTTTYFDNVKVTLNPKTLPPIVIVEPFQPAQPDTGLVLPPTVIARDFGSMEAIDTWTGSGVSSVLIDVTLSKGIMTASSNGQELASLEEFLSATTSKLIPILRVEDPELAAPLADFLRTRNRDDLHIISSQPEIVTKVRMQNPSLRGGLIYTAASTDIEDLRKVEKVAHGSRSNVVIMDERTATAEAIQFIQLRGLVVWVMASNDVKSIHEIIHNGANGILSSQPSLVIEALGKYEPNTISHHQFFVAHRGNTSYTHENTVGSFEESTRIGADVLEFDLYRSKDGEIIVFHNSSFSAAQGGGTPASRNYYGDIDQINLDGDGAKVPTFRQVLEAVKRSSETALVFPETKVRNLANQVYEILVEEDMVERVVVQSFDVGDLEAFHAIDPGIGTLYLINGTKATGTLSEAKSELDYLTQINSIYGPNYKRIYQSLRDYGVMRGLVLWPWTLTSLSATAEQVQLGTHAIMTDYVDKVTNDPIRLRAVQPSVQVDVDESTEVQVEKLFRVADPERLAPSELVVVAGKDVVQISGNKVTGLREGTAIVLAKAEIMLSGATFLMYSEPIEITVGDGVLPPVEAAELSDIGLKPGSATATTSVSGLQSDKSYKYVKGSADAYTRPYEGDAPTDYADELTALTNISAKIGDCIYIVELDDAGNIAKWAALTVKKEDLKAAEDTGTDGNTGGPGNDGNTGGNTENNGNDEDDGAEEETVVSIAALPGATVIGKESAEQLRMGIANAGSKAKAKLTLLSEAYAYAASEASAAPLVSIPITGTAGDAPIAVYGVQPDGSLRYVGGRVKDNVIEVTLPGSGTYVVLAYDKKFADVAANHWAYQAIRELSARFIVSGVDNEHFNPVKDVTRAEFVAMLVRTLGLKSSGTAKFIDVTSEDWYAEAVAAATEAGIVAGISADKFGPNQKVTREQMAVFLERAYSYKMKQAENQLNLSSEPFVDFDNVSDWAKESLRLAHALGLVSGQGAGKYAPANRTTRAEAAMAISNLIEKLFD